MELPIDLLKQIDEFVAKLDDDYVVLPRHIAIREAARLLVCLTHDEYYGKIDAFDKSYDAIADACRAFVEA